MARKITRIFACLAMIIGLGLMCYPSFANYINQLFMNREINDYDKQISEKSDEEIQQILDLALSYNASLPVAYPVDPFTGANVRDFTGTEYQDFYMVQQGQMIGYVEIPSIDVYLPIYYGTSEETLLKGAGLVDNTSLPVGGAGTHAVISAHTGLASRKMFTDLTEVEKGDVFFIHVLNMDLAYEVDQIKVVLPDETDDLYIEENKDYVTLLTCTPFGINDHRLLVRGERIDYDFEKENNTLGYTASKIDMYTWVMLISIAVVIVFGFIYIRKRKRKDKITKN